MRSTAAIGSPPRRVSRKIWYFHSGVSFFRGLAGELRPSGEVFPVPSSPPVPTDGAAGRVVSATLSAVATWRSLGILSNLPAERLSKQPVCSVFLPESLPSSLTHPGAAAPTPVRLGRDCSSPSRAPASASLAALSTDECSAPRHHVRAQKLDPDPVPLQAIPMIPPVRVHCVQDRRSLAVTEAQRNELAV